jgi:hypothetical protein
LRASKYPYEDAITDVTRGETVREREFAWLDAPGAPPPAYTGAAVRELSSGFYGIGGGAVDGRGRLYFVDRKNQRIYRWADGEGLTIVRDDALDPVNLGIDASGNLLVLSSDGPHATVYSLTPGNDHAGVQLIEPVPARDRPATRVLLPANVWDNGEFRDQLDLASYRFTTPGDMFARDIGTPKASEYVSPDGSLVLPAFRVVQQGPPNFLGWRFSDTLDTYGFISVRPSAPLFLISGAEDRTYQGVVGEGGAVTQLKPFAERGGESVAQGPDGRVYIANGQVFVYDPAGNEVGRIDVPERPLQLIFGGADGRTLFMLAQHALYAARP